MAAQPHIPYAILPKRFEPKQVSNNGQMQQTRSNNNANGNNTNGGRRRRRRSAAAGNGVPLRRNQRQQDFYDDQWEDDEEDLWLEPMPPMMRRRLARRPNRNYPPTAGYYGPRGMVNLLRSSSLLLTNSAVCLATIGRLLRWICLRSIATTGTERSSFSSSNDVSR